MLIEGGCYCQNVRYTSAGPMLFKAECYCRECQYISGGGATMVCAVPSDSFAITHGAPKSFARGDLAGAVTREFCADCGTHLFTRAPLFPQGVILKVGTLDDPATMFGRADFAAFACDAQPFHRLPTDQPVHQRWPAPSA